MSSKTVERHYWDTACYLALLNEEPEAEDCRKILEKAAEGEIELVTSFWTMAEVIRKRGSEEPLSAEVDSTISDFFENDYLRLRTVDRLVAEKARELCRAHDIVYACDGVHLATALLTECHVFETKDKDLKTLSRKLGEPLLEIRNPRFTGQERIFDGQ